MIDQQDQYSYIPLPKPVRITEQCWPESSMPLVSITCTTYNHVNFIREAIEGFLMQETTFPVEILIHDDASKDGTADIVREYEATYPKLIQCFCQNENTYARSDRQKLRQPFVDARRGNFVAFCEGDDYWTKADKLEKQISFLLSNPSYVMCWTRFSTLDQESRLKEGDKNDRYFLHAGKGVEFDFDMFCYTGWHIGMQTLVYKRSALNLDHLANKKYYRDVFLISDLLFAGKGYCLSDYAAVYRIHVGGVHSGASDAKKIAVAEHVYREIAETYSNHKGLVDKYLSRSNQLVIYYLKNKLYRESLGAYYSQVKTTRKVHAVFPFIFKAAINKAKQKAKSTPGVVSLYRRISDFKRYIDESLRIFPMLIGSYRARSWNPKSNLIISLTSFPARIDYAWIAIESLFQQDLRPWKVVLVLSDEEFPTRKLPKSILRQQARGLEILWTSRNTRSFKKLLPTRAKYPDATIVTADDDTLYEPWRLQQLYETAQRMPNTIIGHRGWVVRTDEVGLTPYVSWPAARPNTPSDRCFLTGVGLILYPPRALPLERLLDVNLALEICPLADDIWFWAVAREADVPCYCLGNHSMRSIHRLKTSPALCTQNWGDGQNDIQLRAVIDKLGLSLV